ncbi:MAG: 4-carboxymuconolactone decarboxylase [Solirubrobacterales bacterium]|jgi:4-carboxymuconolactone decarboxylase|nr:4-carboxymuconolactone decarboxylase [Solirubrobacterales bacterium]
MSRIEGRSPRQAGPLVGPVLRLARRKTRQLTGRETELMIGPLEAYAHVPRLLLGYSMLEQATAKLDRVPERLKLLAELKAATMTTCEYCIDIGSQIARRAGLSDAELLALPRYRESEEFDDLEKLVMDYAVGMSSTPVAVGDELFAQLRERFEDAQLVELTNVIALENMRGRFNLALGFGSAGFSEGMVCALAEPGSDTRQVAAGAPA